VITDGDQPGRMSTLKPPYPYSTVGRWPSRGVSLRAIRNIGQRVPSRDLNQTCSTANRAGSIGAAICPQIESAPVRALALPPACR
jgi:hypothetical protein